MEIKLRIINKNNFSYQMAKKNKVEYLMKIILKKKMKNFTKNIQKNKIKKGKAGYVKITL